MLGISTARHEDGLPCQETRQGEDDHAQNLYIECDINRTVKVGSTARNSLSLSKVWLLVSRFLQNSQKFSVFFFC